MKTGLLPSFTAGLMFGLLGLRATAAPGTVCFANHNATRVINGHTGNPVTAAEGVRVALYWSPLGSNNFVQIGMTASVGVPVAGVFAGGTRNCGTDTAGGTIGQFQVKAWSGGFASYEEAEQTGGGMLGHSTVFEVKTGDPGGTPPTPPALLFGSGLAGFSVITIAPEIAVEQPAGVELVDGTATATYGSVLVGSTSNLAFNIKNTGNGNLTGLGITIDGPDAAMFTVTAGPTAPVSGPSGSTSFTVQFAPTSYGAKTAALHIANNDPDENPFDINLTGTGNRPPLPASDSAGVSLAQILTLPALKLVANDTDPDGDPLTVTAVASPSALGATLSLASGVVTYNAPVSGTSDSFTYTVSDGRGGTALGTVNVTLSGGSAQGFNQLTSTVLPGGDIKLTFLGIPSLRYALERKHDLGEPAWVPLMTNQVQTNGWLFFTNRPSVPGPDFYRTRHVP